MPTRFEITRCGRGGRLRRALRALRPVAFALAVVVVSVGCAPARPAGADLILTGGRIYVDGTPDHLVSALAIEGDRVLAVGTDDAVRALAGEDTQEMDLLGLPVLPGMYDAWFDLAAAGWTEEAIDVTRAATLREVQAAVRVAAATSERRWLVGGGWDESLWAKPELPDARALDAAGVDRPVVLWHHSMEFAWANSVALRALAAEGAEPFFWRDVAGSPTGLIDAGFGDILARLAGPGGREARAHTLLVGLQKAAAAGFTALTTAPMPLEALTALGRLRDEGLLQLRLETRLLPAALESGWSAAAELGDGLAPRAVGVRLDLPLGAAARARGGGSAARPPERWSAERFAHLCERAGGAGLRLDAHAHGEAAVELALSCPAIAAGEGWLIGVDVAPQRTESLAGARLAVVPTRLAHDAYFLERLLPADAHPRLHAYATFVRSGALRAFASLAPAYPPAPLLAVRTAWRRRTADDYPLDGITPAEALTVRRALRLALAPGVLDRSATLEAGEPADLVVWSEDPYAGGQALRRARALLTMVAGRVVFSRPLLRPKAESDADPAPGGRPPAP